MDKPDRTTANINRETDHSPFRDSVPEPLGFIAFGPDFWLYHGDTRTEDKTPQGCDLSAASSAGMASDGFKLEAVVNLKLQNFLTHVNNFSHDLYIQRRFAPTLFTSSEYSPVWSKLYSTKVTQWQAWRLEQSSETLEYKFAL